MPGLIDLTNRRFGRLLVVRQAGQRPARWLCRCDCGQTRIVGGAELRAGETRSCGCLRRSAARGPRPLPAQHRDLPVAQVWSAMVDQDTVPVCDRWRRSFTRFFADVGDCPTPEHRLVPIDPAAGFAVGNVLWTSAPSPAPTRGPRRVTCQAREFELSDLARQFDVDPDLVAARLDAGMTLDDALRRRVIPDATPRTRGDA